MTRPLSSRPQNGTLAWRDIAALPDPTCCRGCRWERFKRRHLWLGWLLVALAVVAWGWLLVVGVMG